MEATQDNTLKLRIDNNTLALLEKARGYLDVNKSKFIRQSIRDKAEAVIADNEKIIFSEADWHRFFELVENPPPPSDSMRRAAARHKGLADEHGIRDIKSQKTQ